MVIRLRLRCFKITLRVVVAGGANYDEKKFRCVFTRVGNARFEVLNVVPIAGVHGFRLWG